MFDLFGLDVRRSFFSLVWLLVILHQLTVVEVVAVMLMVVVLVLVY